MTWNVAVIDLHSPMTDAPSHTRFLPASQSGVVSQREAAVLGQCSLAAAVLGTGRGRVPALPLPRAIFAPLLRRSAPGSRKGRGSRRCSPAGWRWPRADRGECFWSGPTLRSGARAPHSGGCNSRGPALLTGPSIPCQSPGCAFSVQDTCQKL